MLVGRTGTHAFLGAYWRTIPQLLCAFDIRPKVVLMSPLELQTQFKTLDLLLQAQMCHSSHSTITQVLHRTRNLRNLMTSTVR